MPGEMSKQNEPRVVIVGAGPVGMVCALALNRRGVPVTVFEQEPAPVEDQRAATIHPTTLEMLDELGITQQITPLRMLSTTYRFHGRGNRPVAADCVPDTLRHELKFRFALQWEQ